MLASIVSALRRFAGGYAALAFLVILLTSAAVVVAAPSFLAGQQATDSTPHSPVASSSVQETQPQSDGANQGSGAPANESGVDVQSTEDVQYAEGSSAHPRNIVSIQNRKDGALKIRGSIQLNRITSTNANPLNLARAWSSCTDCSSLAVAMQLNLITRNTHVASPQNYAIAINYECLRCHTIAFALQYTFSVDDPRAVPRDVQQLIKEMDKELKTVAHEKGITLSDAITRINDVISRFSQLALSLRQQRDDETASTTPGATNETPAPSPSVTAEPIATPSPTDSPTPSLVPSPS